jgi:hypothetical protein
LSDGKAKTPNRVAGFYVAPFGIDGEQEGLAFRKCEELSPQWLAICSHYLAVNGESFEAPWDGNLSRIVTRVTAKAGRRSGDLQSRGSSCRLGLACEWYRASCGGAFAENVR